MGTAFSVSPSQRVQKTNTADMSSTGSYGSFSSADSSNSKKCSGPRKPSIFFSTFNLKKISGNSKRNSLVSKAPKIETVSNGTNGLEKSFSCFTITNPPQRSTVANTKPQQAPALDAKYHGAVHCKGRATISLLKKSETFPANTQNNNNNVVPASRQKKTIIQASTSELLKCLGEFLCRRCKKVECLKTSDVATWIRMVDRSLMYQGWQEIGFINPANLVFIYMLLRDLISENIEDEHELKTVVLTCLYISYSYMGNEISYPLKPFIIESSRDNFWNRCISILNLMSGKMLQINADPLYFTRVLSELKTFVPEIVKTTNEMRQI